LKIRTPAKREGRGATNTSTKATKTAHQGCTEGWGVGRGCISWSLWSLSRASIGVSMEEWTEMPELTLMQAFHNVI